MKRILVAALVLSMASAAMAQPWYVRGTFNSWSGTGTPMTWDGTRFAASIDTTGFTPGSPLEFKVTEDDWDPNFPPTNVFTYWPVDSFFDVFFYPGTTNDGWLPTDNRVGYENSFGGWQVMGSFNGWSTPINMTHAGNGFYYADVTVPGPGVYEFKFRQPGVNGDWWSNIGIHFGENAPNATFEAWGGPETHRFELDLPGGRYRSYYIPEPATLVLLALGGMALLRRRS